MRTVEEWLAAEPFRAPEADELAELKLGSRELAAAVHAGRLTRITDGVVLGPDVFDQAAGVLATLPQPFTVAQAKKALHTTRRVAVPLLEQLDATAHHPTRRRRHPDVVWRPSQRVAASPGTVQTGNKS